MIRPNFETSLKKGAVGEMIVRRNLEGKGWVIYEPVTDGAHCFDMMGIKDKKTAIALDVKAKARMNKWPATGINQQHFDEYQHFSLRHNMPFWVVFVDEAQRTIYGNTIQELEKERIVNGQVYPFQIETKYGKKIRLWPLASMIEIDVISDEDSDRLIMFNQRGHEYCEQGTV